MPRSTSIGWLTATAVVIANMIGSGIFTSLGFQLDTTTNSWSILLLWSLGALMALCGALSYAELGTHWVRSGGEYHFLSKAFHPAFGYLSGWVSLTAGFAAPVALSGMALGEYVGSYVGIKPVILALFTVLTVASLHSLSLRQSSLLQNITTSLKVLLITIFIVFGLYYPPESSALLWTDSWKAELFQPAFAVSFVFVTFSYSGWNAAAYIGGEIKNPRKNLPKALLTGTLVVSLLYLLLNYVFLRQNSLDALKGQLEIGQITAISIFGPQGGVWVSFGIAVLLVSSISAMTWAGPRVIQVLGEDHYLWNWFGKKTSGNIPLRAIWLQTSVTLVLILTGTFEQVLIYTGFVLQLFATFTVAGVFVVRRKKGEQRGFKSPFYPVPQLLFLGLSFWVLTYLLIAQPFETGLGVLNLVLGFLVYRFDRWLKKQRSFN